MRAFVLLGLLAAALAASVAAADPPPPTLKATVKAGSSSYDVVITNHDKKTYTGFLIDSTDSPKITAASDKTCRLATSEWASKGKNHVDYWAICTKTTVKPGKSLDVTMTTSGNGTVFVWATVGGTQYPIGQGG